MSYKKTIIWVLVLRRRSFRSFVMLSFLIIVAITIYNLRTTLNITVQSLRFRHLSNWSTIPATDSESRSRSAAKMQPPSYGEQRARNLRDACSLELQRAHIFYRTGHIYVLRNNNHNFLFCPMCKLSMTFWRRFFGMLTNYEKRDVTTPYDIPIPDAPKRKEQNIITQNASVHPQLQGYKAVFVRDPYSRIFSAYIDKLFAPNPTFWKSISQKVILQYKGMIERPTLDSNNATQECGSDLTFHEYVLAIVQAHNRDRQVDCHDAAFLKECHICDVQYDFVGKLESFVDDSLFLIRKLGLNKTLGKLEDVDHFRSLADQDALEDTIRSPFRWKSEIEKCITWDNALRRVWRKLQIRGVIGKDEFPLSIEESDRITVDDMVALVMKTKTRTSYKERKAQRKAAMIEIYRTVPMDLLLGLRKVYARDFSLLEYDESPPAIFDRNGTIEEFGYLDV